MSARRCPSCRRMQAELEAERAAHRRAVRALQTERARLVGEVELLQAAVDTLTDRVQTLEHEASRHSKNSSKPPSADTATQRAEQKAASAQRGADASSRTQGKRRPGKQPGDPGRHLAQVERPDETVVHTPDACSGCGASLRDAAVEGAERRQVFDIPAPALRVVEHVCQRRRCPCCGELIQASFPTEATAPACWGPRVRALACYLLVRQHLPVKRTAELLSDVVGAPVSTGWLSGLPAEAAAGLQGFLDHVRAELQAAPVIGVDETGANVGGAKWWFHTVSTDLLTLVDCHPRRGVEATQDMGVLPEFHGVAVHDRWKPYWHYGCLHALCGAHLLRDLATVCELASQEGWAQDMIDLLLQAKARTARAAEQGRDGLSRGQRRRISSAYDAIIARGIAANPEPLTSKHPLRRASFNLVRALQEHKDEALRFCADVRVPFDNNRSERDLRMIKLQHKISGCFRTPDGARAFCAVRSYLQTAAKQGMNLLHALDRLFGGDPWMPAAARAP